MSLDPAGPGLQVVPELRAHFAAAGISTVSRVLECAECVRDLPDRSNHILRLGSTVIHIKRTKHASVSAEAEAIAIAREIGIATAEIALIGVDERIGALLGTFDLAPARPLDELLREGRIPPHRRKAILYGLATAVGRLHARGCFPRDLYLNHAFVEANPDPATDPVIGCAVVTLIDLERMRLPRLLRERAAARDLAALRSSVPDEYVSTAERWRFLESYFPPGTADRRRMTRMAARIEAMALRIRRHVPRTPVGDAARPVRPSP